MWEAFMMEDAEVCIVSCGITARVSRNAIVEARKQGIKAGMIRPITLWPFPKAPLRKAADQVKRSFAWSSTWARCARMCSWR